MTFDPTTNRIPFVLLTLEERASLMAWPHGWEHFGRFPHRWNLCDSPEWAKDAVYRGLPKLVVTSKWFNVCNTWPASRSYPTRETADEAAGKARIAVLRIDTCNGVSTAHLEDV